MSAKSPILPAPAVWAALAWLPIGLSGCVTLLPPSTPAQLYQFVSAPDPEARPRTGTLSTLRPVVISPISFTRPATSDGILTMTGDQAAYIAGARWVAPARVLFQEALENQFGVETLRTRLAGVGDAGRNAIVLDVRVSRFEADYEQAGGAPRIEVVLDARLSAQGAVLAAQRFREQRPAADNSVKSIVAAYAAAVAAAVHEVGAWSDQAAAQAPTAP